MVCLYDFCDLVGSDNGVSQNLLMEHIDKCGDTNHLSEEDIKGFNPNFHRR